MTETKKTQTPPAPVDADQATAQRLVKLTELIRDYGDPYRITRFDGKQPAALLQQRFAALAPGEKSQEQEKVRVAGRVMAIRNNGMFLDLLDDSGRIQVFHNLKEIDERTTKLLKLLDLGDIVGAEGVVRRTPRGELTVDATWLSVLAKALENPPEKYHGLKDVDFRYRHREQDLVATEKTRTTLRQRSLIIRTIRKVLDDRGFLEVETPILHNIAGGALAKPFATHHNALNIPLYLRIATELHLKRLVIGGVCEKVYEIGRIFRNEGVSPKHNPEFTSIEVYQAFVDMDAMMELVEIIMSECCKAVHGTTRCTFNGVELNFTPPFRRASMLDLIKEHTGQDFGASTDIPTARTLASKAGVGVDPKMNWGQIVEAVFASKVEKHLIQPTHVTGIPKDISPLAKADPEQPHLALRFETFANTWEIAPAFSELNDPREQRKRFEEQVAAREKGDDEAHPIDEEFLKAMNFGMPPMGGMGMGIDRLVMLLTDSQTIKEVIAFPTLRPMAS
jgi:lysyl-tRNA synthetase class 2